jgi:hypothetical protein
MDDETLEQKNTKTLIKGLVNNPKALKYILNIKESEEVIKNSLKVVYKLPMSIITAAVSLSKSFEQNMASGLLRSGLLENIAEIEPKQAKEMVTEVFKSTNLKSIAADVNQQNISNLAEKAVTVLSSVKNQQNSLIKDIGNTLSEIVKKPSIENKPYFEMAAHLYSAVKDSKTQKAVSEVD